jgi:hypothetical protein
MMDADADADAEDVINIMNAQARRLWGFERS